MASTQRNTAHEAAQITGNVAEKRKKQITDSFPQLKREQFTSDEAYREALLEQYRTMRQQEYQYVCLNEGIKAYDVTLSICARTRNAKAMNRACWNGCTKVMQQYPDLQEFIADSCYVRIPTDVTNSLAGGNESCCAVASKALESKISAEMGFDGSDNFIKPYHKGDGKSSCHRAANGFMQDPACKGYTAQGNLWNLLQQGKVGPGATIAVRNGNITESGYHAKTIIAVNYDDKGKLKSYVLQANNANRLEVITGPHMYNNVLVGDMNRWMTEQLNREAQQKRELSTDELAQAIEQERAKLSQRVSDLEKTESRLFNTKGSVPQVTRYASAYVMNAGIPEATPAIIKIDSQNAQTEAERQTQNIRQKQKRKAAPVQENTQTPEKPATPRTAAQSKPAEPKAQTTQNRAASAGASSNDEQRMRDMLNKLNRINGAGKHVDVEETIKSLKERFGDNASKILAKAMMSSKIFAKQGMKIDKGQPVGSTREVLQQLCKMDDEKQRQEVLQIKLPSKKNRGR